MSQLKRASKQPCYLLLLMPELRLQIACEFDYFALKQFGATCKSNLELLKVSEVPYTLSNSCSSAHNASRFPVRQSPIFDKPLFRSKPADFKLKEGMPVFLHPLLQLVSNLRINNVKHAIIFPKGGDWRKVVSCIDLKAANENATFPPTKKVCFDSYLSIFENENFPGEVNAIGDRAVTVKQVIETIVRMWNTPCPMRKSMCGRFTMTVYEAIEIAFDDLKTQQWPGWRESIVLTTDKCEAIVLRPKIWRVHCEPNSRIGISEYGGVYSMLMIGGDPFE